MARPTKYKPEYCELLIKHMAEGHSFETFAATIGAGKSTLYDWAKQFPEFSEAKQKGQSKSLRVWEDLGWQLAKKGNAAIWIFCMKNKFGWTDKREVEQTNTNKEIKIDVFSNENPLRKNKQTG